MSWTVDDWMAGLSGRALQKVRELEAQQEQLKREKQQRQLKLDSTEAALSKQKLKYDEVRSELTVAQRDLQSSQKEAQAALRAQERLSQELQVKQAQVCSLEGQLDAARTLTHSLTQAVKRLEAELEKMQNASSSGDSALFSTPCWSMSSSRDNGSQWDERTQHIGEGEIKTRHVRQLQFGDCSPSPPLSGTMPSQLPHNSTPVRQPTQQSNCLTSSAVFPWEREDAPSVSKGRPVSSRQTSYEVSDLWGQQDCGMENDLRKEIDVQRSEIQKLQTWVQSLEQEARSASDQRRGMEAQLTAVRAQLVTREQDLTRTREELTRASASLEKENGKVLAAEQRLKQLQEELSCLRQNAESSRRSAEQSRREMEKDHHRELLELQKDKQIMEREYQQEGNRLKQEVQRAQTLHNTLQAQCDKVSLQKQAVEKDLDTVKGKLQWTEKELLEKHKLEEQMQCKLAEALREQDSLAVRLEQSERRAKGLEEEVKRLTQEWSEALRRLEELQAMKLAVPATEEVPVRFTPAGDNFPPSNSRHEHLQQAPLVQRKKAPSQTPIRENHEVERIEGTIKARYPADREPGEGIDSSDIRELGAQTTGKPAGGDRRQKDEDGKTCEDGVEVIPERSQRDIEGIGASVKEQNDMKWGNAELREVRKADYHHDDDQVEAKADESLLISSTDQDGHSQPTLQDLKNQDTALNDELLEVKRELERRLEDLEAQRRAETEARTRLKQVSRKHSSQLEQLRQKAQDLKGENERLENELEEERTERRRIKEAMDGLERRRREEQMDVEKETKETVILREEVTKLESQLRQVQEEQEKEKDLRKQDEDKRRTEKEHELERRRTLTERIAELEAELVELRENRDREPGKGFGETSDNTEDSNNNTDTVTTDSSPCHHSSQSVDPQSKMPFSHKEINNKDQVKPGSDLDNPLEKKGVQEAVEKILFQDETVQLVLELERLRRACEALQNERDKETERARQAHGKLEALQTQVNSQTQQLTLAFESQSCHIQDLLQELKERDSALQRLEGELQAYQAEIEMLKAERQELELEGKGPEQVKSVMDVAGTPNPQLNSCRAKCEAIKSMLQTKNLHPPVLLEQQGCDDSAGVQILEGLLCGTVAENKELQSKLEALTHLNDFSHISLSTEPGDHVDGDTTHKLMELLQAAQNELIHLRDENKKLVSTLAEVTPLGMKEDEPFDPKVRMGSLDNRESEAATKRSIEELHPAQTDLNPTFLNEHGLLRVELNAAATRMVNQEEPGQKRGGIEDHQSNGPCSLAEKLLLSTLLDEELKLKSELCVHSGGEWVQAEEQDVKAGGGTGRSEMNQDELNQLEREKAKLVPQIAVISCLRKQAAAANTSGEESVSLHSAHESITLCKEFNTSEEGENICGSKKLHNTDKFSAVIQEYVNVIITLLGEYKILQTWACSESPLEKQEEMPTISGGVRRWIDSVISALGSAEGIEKLLLALPLSQGSQKMSEVNGAKIMAVQRSSVQLPDQDLSTTIEELDLKIVDAHMIQTEAEGRSLISHGRSHTGHCLSEAVTVTGAETKLYDESQGVQDCDTQSRPEEDGNPPLQITILQQQLLELQAVVSSLVEENKRQAEELEVWRMARDTHTTVSFGEPVIHTSTGSVMVVREDHVFISCRDGNLVESMPNAERMAEDDRKPVFLPEAAARTAPGGTGTGDPLGAYGDKGIAPVSIELSAADGDDFRDLKTKAVAHREFGLNTETSDSSNNDTSIQISVKDHQDRAIDMQHRTTKQADMAVLLNGKENKLSATVWKTTSEKIKMAVQEDDWTEAIVDPECQAKVNSNGEDPTCTLQDAEMTNERGAATEPEGLDLEQSEGSISQGVDSAESTENLGEHRESQKEWRSMGTQTEGMNRDTVTTLLTASPGSLEMRHAITQTEGGESKAVEDTGTDSPPLLPVDTATPMAGSLSLLSRSFPIPADPARLAERIRRNRSRMSAAFDDTEYEPYGLPEVVMKGFADIPSGPACPYVLRRGLLGTDAMPLPLREQEKRGQEDEADP